jgi:hypothetical protein
METTQTEFLLNDTGNWLVKHKTGTIFYMTPEGVYLPTEGEKQGNEITQPRWENLLKHLDNKIQIPNRTQRELIGQALQKRNSFFQKRLQVQKKDRVQKTAFDFSSVKGFDTMRKKFTDT